MASISAERVHPNVEHVPPGSVHPNPANARRHSKKQLGQIAASILRFGFLVPIVVDDSGMIAAGHGRWSAALELGLTSVPVVRARFVSDEDRRAFALAENRVAELSDWDEDLLAAELNALFDSGYDLDVTGFSTADLDFSLPEEAAASAPEQVELPDPSSEAISLPGDLWHIGPHRLYCGDSRFAESYETLLGGDLATMIFSDPPYGVKIDGHVSGLGTNKHREFAMMSGEQTPAELTAFLRTVFRQCARFSRPASIHFQCMDWRHAREILDAADGVYTEFKQLCVWLSDRRRWGHFIAPSMSFCLCSSRGAASTRTISAWGRPEDREAIYGSMLASTALEKGVHEIWQITRP